MKNFLSLVLVLSCILGYSQNEKTYYNEDWKKVNSADNASFYRTLEFDSTAKVYHASDFYITGEKYRIASYKSLDPEVKQGISVWYRKSGIKLKETFYKDDELNGTYVEYRDNGHIESILRYKGGKLLSRDYFSTDGSPIMAYIPMTEIQADDFSKYEKADLVEYAKKNIEWILKNPANMKQPQITKYTIDLIEKGLDMKIALDKKLYKAMLKDNSYRNNSYVASYMVIGAAQYQLSEEGEMDLSKHKEASAKAALKAYKAYIKADPDSKSESLNKYLKLEKSGKLTF